MAPNKTIQLLLSAVFLHLKKILINSVLASIDETNDSDGSIMCLGLLGAAPNFEKSDKLSKPFRFCEASGDALLDTSPDLPRLDTSTEELPTVSASPMRKWVQIDAPSEKIMTGMLKCLDIDPMTKNQTNMNQHYCYM